LGYSAAYVPGLRPEQIAAYASAAVANDLVLAEVGAWSNPLSDDPRARQEAIDKCINALSLADEVGARLCVNIAGSRGQKWDGPHPKNLTRETFDMIVQIVRHIIDSAKPKRTYYTLETMPWIWPDSADAYLQLIHAIDRKQFAVHLDPVNIINCPARIFDTKSMLRDCFEKLGPYIRGCHGKDITIANNLTLHLDECLPGTGYLDYAEFLRQLDRLHPDTPLMLEHLSTPEEFDQAAAHVRKVAKQEGIEIR
jgi:sugar phosphate isomerase/epimerase